MRKRLIFVAGVAVGYVLGARAGRERFDDLVAQSRRFWESPTVQEAAGILQARAARLYGQGKYALNDRLATRRMKARWSRRYGTNHAGEGGPYADTDGGPGPFGDDRPPRGTGQHPTTSQHPTTGQRPTAGPHRPDDPLARSGRTHSDHERIRVGSDTTSFDQAGMEPEEAWDFTGRHDYFATGGF
jgi:hypothetical protein